MKNLKIKLMVIAIIICSVYSASINAQNVHTPPFTPLLNQIPKWTQVTTSPFDINNSQIFDHNT